MNNENDLFNDASNSIRDLSELTKQFILEGRFNDALALINCSCTLIKLCKELAEHE